MSYANEFRNVTLWVDGSAGAVELASRFESCGYNVKQIFSGDSTPTANVQREFVSGYANIAGAFLSDKHCQVFSAPLSLKDRSA